MIIIHRKRWTERKVFHVYTSFWFSKIEFISDIIGWLWSGELKVAICHNVRAIIFNTQYSKQWLSEDFNVWANQKTGMFPIERHILEPWKVTDGTSDFTVQYSKTQVYGVLITFGIMFFFNFGFDISFLFMKSFVKKENFRFLLIRRCHISRIWNFSLKYVFNIMHQVDYHQKPCTIWMTQPIIFRKCFFFEKSIPEVIINCFDKFVSIFQSFCIELRKVTLMGLFISF